MENNKKSTRIGFIGRPNAGKSTLLNAVVGYKLAAVSRKAQTSRYQIQGVLQEGDLELVFVDTPGVSAFKTDTLLHKQMVQDAFTMIDGVDQVVWLLDKQLTPSEWDIEFFLNITKKNPLVVYHIAFSQADKVSSESKRSIEMVWREWLETLEQACVKQTNKLGMEPVKTGFVGSISAKDATQYQDLLDTCKEYATNRIWDYPDGDLSNKSQKFIVAEWIQEQLFRQLGEEVPHHTHVFVEEWEETLTRIIIRACIVVSKNSYKGMVLGKNGAKIKSIRTESQKTMAKHFDRPVHLEIFIKVEENWQNKVLFLNTNRDML
jgi:GTPase